MPAKSAIAAAAAAIVTDEALAEEDVAAVRELGPQVVVG